jgi:UDP-glucose 4-epimerase
VSLFNLTRTTPLHAVIVRPFNISGPRQSGKGGFVLPRFIGQALTGRDLTVFGDGSQVRAFTHVQDMAHGIVLAAEHGQTGNAYNLGNIANKMTILQLAEAVREIVNPKVKITSVDPKQLYGPLFEEANDKFPDATLANRELGWVPQHSFTQTIRDTYEYMARLPAAELEAAIGHL